MSTVFQIASDLVDDLCERDPVLCTALGIAGRDHEWGDGFGLSGIEGTVDLVSAYRSRLVPFLESEEPGERQAARVVVSSLEEQIASYDGGDHFLTLRHMASPFHQIRLVFDIMRTDTHAARDAIVTRLDKVDYPLQAYRDLLQAGIDNGQVVSSRQVISVIGQARRMADEPDSIDAILARAGLATDVPAVAAGNRARQACAAFADWLESSYLPHASETDGVGADAYQRAADRLVGMTVDPEDAYAWGWEEFERLSVELDHVADQIIPGAGVDEVKEYLETDPSVTASGTDELLAFVETTLTKAVEDLSGTHFDVPGEIRPITVQLAPPGGPLGVYYRGPSEDFSRPGGVWYSIGDQQVFPLYQHVSTAYHEGFPGHHLQIATAMHRRDEINRFQRLMIHYPGYSEGWGMYAEVLMGELGYLEDPQHYFGMLAKQMYRTARVVVDLGLHLGKRIDPRSPVFPGEPWTFERAVDFMRVYGFRTAAQARDEVLRYLGWPGQAISYKLGERATLSIREEARRRLGPDFDMKRFHSTVIGHGAMRFDVLSDLVEERLG